MKVFLFDKLAGLLEGTSENGITFTYDSAYIASGGQPLSISLPLQSGSFSQKQCLPFFEGLLPEGDLRKAVADHLHISDRSVLKLLGALGKECAGTVSIAVERARHQMPKYKAITNAEIAEMIRNRPFRPFIHGNDEVRLSLAGAQDKIALAYINGKWHLPLNGAPSTHILKPSRDADLFKTIAANEFVCMKLAAACGLNVPRCDLTDFAGYPVFIAERYDRHIVGKVVKRLHQEDVCQALGIHPDNKYESDGGPSVTTIVQLLEKYSSQPILDIQHLLKSVLFNFVIGNCDAHGKNFSLLENDGQIQLSPLYDLVSTLMYPGLTQKFSMKIGKRYDTRKINWSDFLEMGTQCKITGKALQKICDAMTPIILDKLEEMESVPEYGEVAGKIKIVAKTQLAKLN